VTMDDGTELIIGAGDGYEIPPGHDVLVIGDEPWESVEFASAHTFGLAPEELGERVLATVIFSDIVGSTAALRGSIPLGRRGNPDEVAPWIVRLADPTSDWVTGQVIAVDGGLGLT
jgi:NAD(P)-dependent dehydrogenase (short-subunit alcohol dehydrogenase family)